MSLSFCGVESATDFFLFFRCGKVGERHVELGIFHVHVDADHALLFRQLQARLNRIVEEVSNDNAEIHLRCF